MSNIPFIAFYPSKWLARCATLSAVERGIFITLICEMYERMQPLRNDIKTLARLCGCTPKILEKSLAVLMEDSNKIIMVDGRLWNERVQKELKKSQKKSEIYKSNAEKRWGKSQKNQQKVDAVALQPQCYPEPEPYNDTIINNSIISKDALEDAPPDGGNLIDKYFDIFLSAVGKDNLSCPSDMQIFSVPVSWIVNGCNPELDIIPVLKAITAKNPNIRSWNYFTNAVYEAKARREAKPPDIQINQASNPQKPNKTDKLFNSIDDVDGIIKNRLTA